MGKNASSCSTEQQKMERNLFPLIEEWLGVELKSDAKVYVGDAHIEPDFINEDEKIVGEIFAHIGTLLEGQKRKLAQDVLKMLLLERKALGGDCLQECVTDREENKKPQAAY